MKMSDQGTLQNRVKSYRQQRGWSQAELADRAGVSRAAVSAIETRRLAPSVAAALALAGVLHCRVEDLFGVGGADDDEKGWAWLTTCEPCRFWHARVGKGILYYPVETPVGSVMPHDGIFEHGAWRWSGVVAPEDTLVLAGCDPAAGLLATEYARASGLRLLVLQRSSREALELLRQGLVHMAGTHLATTANPHGNDQAARSILGAGYSLLRIATWQDGLALGSAVSASSLEVILRSRLRWVGREPGSGARQCQDELLRGRPAPRRLATNHWGVAEAIRCGWADIGVCLRLTCEEAGLKFIQVREETYELCFPTALESDPRLRAMFQVLRAGTYRRWLSDLPGYDGRRLGVVTRVD
jgi:molybdate-binding protein/DNA-binding XRE family transcriptional regulator